MQRLINNPDKVVDDMLNGFLRVHESHVALSMANPRVILVNVAWKNPSVLASSAVVAAGMNRPFLAIWVKVCLMLSR